ncbi:uncharacterized protein LOC135580557 isoform X2 [Columba livia]|uniref:uncharacterized protein LOC135580557 isoform X2 n=1 Tax=Columba livia TaxID=8932 RepID=UPI0031BA6AF0
MRQNPTCLYSGLSACFTQCCPQTKLLAESRSAPKLGTNTQTMLQELKNAIPVHLQGDQDTGKDSPNPASLKGAAAPEESRISWLPFAMIKFPCSEEGHSSYRRGGAEVTRDD